MTSEGPLAQTDSEAPEIRFALLSHDVRSALGGIVGGLSLVDADGLSKTDQGRLNSARAAAQMLAELIEDLGSGAPEKRGNQAEFFPLLEELETRWQVEAANKGVVVAFRQGDDLDGVSELNKTGLMRIYNNLISNAVNNADGGRVLVETCRRDGDIHIKVSDEGPGFSAAALDELFTFGGRPTGSRGAGSGFGLFIVKLLVDRTGGSVAARNRPVGGAVVEVVLKASGIQKPKVKPGGLPDLSHVDILLAEDNVTNQLVATQMLAAMNANVKVASDGVEALQIFEREAFDLCLIDIEMPRKSGLEVIREIRAREDARAATPLVALTAYAMDEHRARIKAAGADGLIAKPLTNIARFGDRILGYLLEPAANTQTDVAAPVSGVIQRDIYDDLANVIGLESMQELLGKVQEDLQNVDNGIRDGLEKNETGPIRANTHILISVAGAIGAVSLQHIAQDLNAAANADDWGEITALKGACLGGLDAVKGFVASELELW